MGDGLQDVPISRHVADSPLAESSAAQPEDVAAREMANLNLNRQPSVLTGGLIEAKTKAMKQKHWSHLPGLWMNLCRRAFTSSYVRKAI